MCVCVCLSPRHPGFSKLSYKTRVYLPPSVLEDRLRARRGSQLPRAKLRVPDPFEHLAQGQSQDQPGYFCAVDERDKHIASQEPAMLSLRGCVKIRSQQV